MWTPRPYQHEAIEAGLDALAAGEDTLLVVPTGGGKSGIIGTIVRTLFDDYGLRIVSCAHVAELVDQAYSELIGMWDWAPAGVYSAGLGRKEMQSQILFAGIQSIFRKAAKVGPIDVLIIDECHTLPRVGNGQYLQFIAEARAINPDMRLLGLTATPYRLGSGRLDEDRVTGEGKVEKAMFSRVAYEVGIRHLIEEGWLAPLTTKDTLALKVDTAGIGSTGGDFKQGELSAAVDKPELISDICSDIIEKGKDRRSWLIFTPGVPDAHHFHEEMQRRGIKGGVIDGTTDPGVRKRLISEFKAYKLRYLVNCGVLTTGFDHKGVDLLAMVRPTKSASLYVQICGRGTRPLYTPGFDPNTATAAERRAAISAGPKPNCLVLDYAKNINYHGPVDLVKPRTPGKGGGPAPVKTCPQCFSVIPASVMQCPDCGHEFERQASENITKRAATAPILSKAEPEWVAITKRAFARHSKYGSPDSVRVEYWAGFNLVAKEWIAVENERAAGLVKSWWRKCGGAEPTPTTVTELLDRVGELQPVQDIRIEADGKYWRITGIRSGGAATDEVEQPNVGNLGGWRNYDASRSVSDDEIPF